MWTGGQTRTTANGSSCPGDWLQPGPQCGPSLSPEAPLLGNELPCQAPQAQRAGQPRSEEPQTGSREGVTPTVTHRPLAAEMGGEAARFHPAPLY